MKRLISLMEKMTIRILFFGVPTVALGISLFLFTKRPGEVNITDRDGNIVGDIKVGAIEHPYGEDYLDDEINPDYIVLYSNSNRWPEHSPFYKKYYGFVNLETGFISDDIYVDLLAFGEDGLAWDYKGHFIDESGNVSITIDNFTEKYSYVDNPRKFFLSSFYKVNQNQYYKYEDKMTLRDLSDIFSRYTSKMNIGDFDECGLLALPTDNGYIYIDKNGEQAIDKTFDLMPGPFNSYGLAVVKTEADYSHSEPAVINKSGEYVIEPSDYFCYIFDGENKIIKAYFDEFNDEHDIYDFNGNKLEK